LRHYSNDLKVTVDCKYHGEVARERKVESLTDARLPFGNGSANKHLPRVGRLSSMTPALTTIVFVCTNREAPRDQLPELVKTCRAAVLNRKLEPERPTSIEQEYSPPLTQGLAVTTQADPLLAVTRTAAGIIGTAAAEPGTEGDGPPGCLALGGSGCS
jgi:hypothetical protein